MREGRTSSAGLNSGTVPSLDRPRLAKNACVKISACSKVHVKVQEIFAFLIFMDNIVHVVLYYPCYFMVLIFVLSLWVARIVKIWASRKFPTIWYHIQSTRVAWAKLHTPIMS